MTDPTVAERQTPSAGDLAARLAPFFPGWKVERPKPEQAEVYAALVRADDDDPNGPAIRFYIPAYGPKRCTVDGRWPRVGAHYYSPNGMRDGKTPEISCDPRRDPAKLAADIKRRFLPDYLETFLAMRARATAHTDGRALVKAAAERIALACEGTLRERNQGDSYHVWSTVEGIDGVDVLIGNGTVDPPSVRFEVKCDEATFLRVVEVLRIA
jgi:hypothetical protein